MTCPPSVARRRPRAATSPPRSAPTCSRGGEEPEHRQATVAFLHFDGTDELLEREGPGWRRRRARRAGRPTSQRAADEHEVTFLGTDIDHDGGKIILVAGVPRAMGDDEERMLGALRRIADGTRRLSVRIGVHRGPIFAGDVGPRVPPDVHRHGRHREPRGPAHGPGRAGPDPRHGRGPRPLAARVRDRRRSSRST